MVYSAALALSAVERLVKSPACPTKGGMRKVRDRGERANLRREVGELRKELRSREASAIAQILKSAEVVLSTNTGQRVSGASVGVGVGTRLSAWRRGPITAAPVCPCRRLRRRPPQTPASRPLRLGGGRRVRPGSGEQLLDRSAPSTQVHPGRRLQAAAAHHQVTRVKTVFPIDNTENT